MKNSSDTIGNGTRDLAVCSAVFTLTDQYNFGMYHAWLVDRDSVVGITTRYGLDGPGIESQWGRDFPHSFTPILSPTQPPIQWIRGLFPGGKAAEAWRLLPPHLAPRLKKE
jgi:hypothetical protein